MSESTIDPRFAPRSVPEVGSKGRIDVGNLEKLSALEPGEKAAKVVGDSRDDKLPLQIVAMCIDAKDQVYLPT